MSEKQKKVLTYIVYSLIILLIFSSVVWLKQFRAFESFLAKIENGTFDLRQTVSSQYKKHNKNIVIVALDDATYEYVMDKFGTWPVSRKLWADTTAAIEKAQPCCIVFDMLFLKPNQQDPEGDRAFIEVVRDNPNIYLSMNFDNYTDEIRKAPFIPSQYRLKIKEGEIPDNDYIAFQNARMTMDEITYVTKNIGAINVTRDDDGIIREVTPVFKYKGGYYPNLSLMAGLDLLDRGSISFIKNSIYIDKKHIIPLDKTRRAILNWYGKNKTFNHIPFWQIIKAQRENDTEFFKKNFENKIIYIGTTATSLSDIKTTPVDPNMAGVELHATFLNNLVDNDFIKRAPAAVDFTFAIILSLIIGYFVLRTESIVKSLSALILVLAVYAAFALGVMIFFNFWIAIVLPFVCVILTFTLTYAEKYLLKSKDYEATYKLAVTDGLTGLYNHRYFQEQMIVYVNNFRRYNNVFSMILIDIDFFKKFNDTYGHQSGDAVLKQVSELLKKNLRTSDIACRYGGEEIAIILPNTAKNDAAATAQKICMATRNHRFVVAGGEKVNVTISLGVASVGIDGERVQDMIEYADKCLYRAKENGRNQVVSELEENNDDGVN